MKIKKITYPTSLDKIENPFEDNIDVFVETEDGYHFTMTVGTPLDYIRYMNVTKTNFIPASPPDIIVKELTYEIVQEALESFCERNGYWMKLYFLSGEMKDYLEPHLDEMMSIMERQFADES